MGKKSIEKEASCVEASAAKLIAAFRQALPCLRKDGQLTTATPSHPEDPMPPLNAAPAPRLGFQFTFSRAELTSALQDDGVSFAVHHGASVASPGVQSLKLLDEHFVPFVSRTRSPLHVDRAGLANVISGRTKDWSQLGGRSGPIRLLGHGGRINQRVLRAFVGQHFDVGTVAEIEFLPTYEALAAATESNADCIAFGLRPAYVHGRHLAPAIVNDVEPWKAGEGCLVPSIPITLAWKSSRAAPLGPIAAYLARVSEHLKADAAVMRMLDRESTGARDQGFLAPASL